MTGRGSTLAVEPAFTTLDKDNKLVWEPGLPAQVVSRRRCSTNLKKDRPEELPVPCELKITLRLAPVAKADWLGKALRAIPRGHAKAQDVYNIVTHPKFSAGVPPRIGRRMLRLVTESESTFSEKQLTTLMTKSELAQFAMPSDLAGNDDDQDEDEVDVLDAMPDDEREKNQRLPGLGHLSQVSQEEQVRFEQEFLERERQTEAQRKRLDAERRAFEERERQRKARISGAFIVGDDEEEAEVPVKPHSSFRRDEWARGEGSVGRPLPYLPSLQDIGKQEPPAANPAFVEAMGGDKILQEAHKILKKASASMEESGGSRRRKSRSRSRRLRSLSRRRRSRSRSYRRSGDGFSSGRLREFGSLRSPTPDGRARGQARAARKAKMIASMLGVDPRC